MQRFRYHRANIPETEVLLVTCPWGSNEDERCEHLGLASLYSFLHKNGISAQILDANLNPKSVFQIVQTIQTSSCNHVGFSVMRTNLEITLKVIDLLRSCNSTVHITLGGHEATLNYKTILIGCDSIDCIVLGEGELTLLELCRRLHDGDDWRSVAGIAYRDGGERIIVNQSRPLVKDLDSLPHPDRENYSSYLVKTKAASIYSSRGCFGQCLFCGINRFYGMSPGSRWRARSPSNVVDEIEMLVRDFGIGTFYFRDDDFMGPGRRGNSRAVQIGRQLMARNLQINYSFLCRPDNIDKKTMAFLKKTGLSRVEVGIESFIKRQLKLYNKLTTRDQNIYALEVLKSICLDFTVFLIPFDPYVTVKELIENLEITEKIGFEYVPLNHIFNRLRITRYSGLYEIIKKDKLLCCNDKEDLNGNVVYSFKHSDSDKAFQYGNRMALVYRTKLQPLFASCSLRWPPEAGQYLQCVEIAMRKWVFVRYKVILQMLAKGDLESADGYFADVMEQMKEQLAKISTSMEQLIQDNFHSPVKMRIDDREFNFLSS